MSAYLRAPGELMIIQFPMNTVREVTEAVQHWMNDRAVVAWQLTEPSIQFAVVMNFGLISQMLVTSVARSERLADEEVPPAPVVQALLERTPSGWVVHKFQDKD